MREIKFRMWDIDAREYLDVDAIIFKPLVLFDNTHPYVLDQHNDCHEFDTVILEQFTGLKDKNGKEIYEGDIVRWDDSNWGYGGDYDTTHDSYLYETVSIKELLTGKSELSLFDEWWKKFDIVGNIHEGGEGK